jgi:putative PEP-CTERM system histidine kinase
MVALAAVAPVTAGTFLSVLVVELIRYTAWFFLLSGLATSAGRSRHVITAAYGTCTAAAIAFLWISAFRIDWLPLIAAVGGFMLGSLGLVALEQVYRSASGTYRRNIKFLCIGLGAAFVFDLLTLTATSLPGVLPEDQLVAARGYIIAMSAPLLGITAHRRPSWSSRLFISRDVAFGTLALGLIAVYVGLVFGVLQLMKLTDFTWIHVAQVVFLASATAGLAALVGSAFLWRRLRVWLVKNFYRHKYDYREEWLRFISTLSEGSAEEDVRATALRAVAQIISSPGAALVMFHEGRAVSDFCWPRDDMSSEMAATLQSNEYLIELLGRRQWVVDMEEYRARPERYGPLELPDWLVRDRGWRLVVPVLLRDQLVGMMIFQDPAEGFSLTFEDRDLLKTVARHVATHLVQMQTEQSLVEARQFEAYSRLSAFLTHDLKNAAAQLDLVVRNARRHGSNPEFIADAIDTVANAAGRITRLIEQLGRGAYVERREPVTLDEIVKAAIEHTQARRPIPALRVEAADLRVVASRDRLTQIVEHLIRNAQDVVSDRGSVTVRVASAGSDALIEVVDDGPGMSRQFVRDRLFRPFQGTKGAGGMGIGVYQAREYARSLGGDVTVSSVPGQGSTFRVRLPVATVAEVA